MAKPSRPTNARVVAAKVLTRVFEERELLDNCLAGGLSVLSETRERSLAQQLCYGVLRWLPRLQSVLGELLERPIRRRDTDVNVLLLLGLYQLEYTRIPAHAAVAETVAASRVLRKSWASGLVNATLRRYQRQKRDLVHALDERQEVKYAHPRWLIDIVRAAWPADWEHILYQNNRRAPMTLRANARVETQDHYRKRLHAAGLAAQPTPHTSHGLTLESAVAVEHLPGFETGAASVQDGAAQLAAHLLDAKRGHRVLDACAAPGGKSAHILETAPEIAELVAIERDLARAQMFGETLSRLGLSANLITSDARDTTAWWDGKTFDRILLDAPCSASGIIRRHPDIKLLREKEDVDRLVELQTGLLEALWSVLAPGGRLVYATCSVFPVENQHRIARFLQRHDDAHELPIVGPWGRCLQHGRQIFPGMDTMDGFYYAVVQKR